MAKCKHRAMFSLPLYFPYLAHCLELSRCAWGVCEWMDMPQSLEGIFMSLYVKAILEFNFSEFVLFKPG